MGRSVLRRGHRIRGGDAAGDDAVRPRARSLEPGSDTPRPLHPRPLAVPSRHRQLRLGRHRHGALGRLRTGLRRAPLASARRAAATGRDLLLLPGTRLARRASPSRPRRASPPASRSSISRSGSTTSRTSTWSPPCGRRSAPAPGSVSMRTAAGRSGRRLAISMRSPSSTSTSSSSPCATIPSATLRSCAAAPRRRCARTRGFGRRPTPTRDPRPTGRRLLLLAVLGRIRRAFQRLAWVAEYEGLQVCKHTHGELGLAAAAAHHVVLTLPNGVEGHQQTAHVLTHDMLTEPLPIAHGPRWGRIDGPGLGVAVDEAAVAFAAARYRSDGQYRPWQDEQLAREER